MLWKIENATEIILFLYVLESMIMIHFYQVNYSLNVEVRDFQVLHFTLYIVHYQVF